MISTNNIFNRIQPTTVLVGKILRPRLVIWFLFLAVTLSSRADQYDALRTNWLNTLLAEAGTPTSVASTATKYWTGSNPINTSPSATNFFLWSDLPLGSASVNMVSTFKRLESMALAYAMPASSLYGNAGLATAVVNGLDWMNANVYKPTGALYDNWFHWEMSGPQSLANTEVLLLAIPGTLSVAQITNYCRAFYNYCPDSVNQQDFFWWGALTGANTSDAALVMTVHGILLGTNSANVTRFYHTTSATSNIVVSGSSLLAEAQANLSGNNPGDFSGKSVFAYVTSGDGFYADGSYIFHGNIAYTGLYGRTQLDSIATIVNLLNGSAWQVTDPGLTNLYSWITKSFEPVIYNGAMMDMVRGRAIASSGSTEFDVGADVIAAVRKVAQFAPPSTALALTNWANSPSLPPGQFHFPAMDRVVALRNGFGFGVSMSSTRIAGYEINTTSPTNLKGWWTGAGMTYLYLGAIDTQFTDDFWATIDWYHLPGTTAEVNATPDDAITDQSWVGGAQVTNTLYGVAGMSQHANSTTLFSKKSWFMLDNKIVCLGAGITSSDNGNAIHTTVEDRRLGPSPTNSFRVNGAAYPPVIGWNSALTNVSWCALDGVGGYYFPGGASSLQASFAASSGAWTTINPNDSDSTIHTNNYLKLWFDHGVKPTNSTYAYVILPNLAASGVSAYAANPDTVIIANSPTVQAVKNIQLGVVGANFWANGGGSADLITVNKAASVMTVETFNTISVGVSDPTQSNPGLITVTLNRAATSVISADPGVNVTQLTPTIIFTVNVNGAKGKTFNASFAQPPQPPVTTSASTATGNQTQPFTYQITANNSPTSFGASGLPPGLSVDTGTGLISGTPSVIGTYNVTISATNSGGTGSATLTITVLPPAPVITSSLNLSGVIGRAFSYQITASNSPLSFNATGLPAGLNVNTNSGVISGTPLATSTNFVTLSAVNAGGTASATATLIVTDTVITFTTSGTWTCPSGVSSIQIACWGGGGAGGSALRTPDSGSVEYGGGGAGGAYARKNSFAVTPGTTYFINVGVGGTNSSSVDNTTAPGGDSWFNSVNSPSSAITAKGGAGGESAIGNTSTTRYGTGGAGTTNGSVGDVVFAGGAGATATNSSAGGGGSSAGTNSTGTSATNFVGAIAPLGGGTGGTGPSTSSGSGTNGFSPGGGGSGARAVGTLQPGGAGGTGLVVLTINTNVALVASFTASPTNGGAPSMVTFTDLSAGAISNRVWNFGDGTTTNTTLTNVLHTYFFPGTNTVSLIVSGAAGSATNVQTNLIVASSVATYGDGVPDWWRVQHFGSTTNSGNAAASADPDGDGLTNLQEYLLGTDPLTPDSAALLSIAPAGSGVGLSFVARQTTGPGYSNFTRRYSLENLADLTNASGWSPVFGYSNIVGGNQTVSTTQSTGGIKWFYRLKAWLQ